MVFDALKRCKHCVMPTIGAKLLYNMLVKTVWRGMALSQLCKSKLGLCGGRLRKTIVEGAEIGSCVLVVCPFGAEPLGHGFERIKIKRHCCTRDHKCIKSLYRLDRHNISKMAKQLLNSL